MMAATRSQKHVAGERPEDLSKSPSNFQKEINKIAQKNKNKKEESAKKGSALKQADTTMNDKTAKKGSALKQSETTKSDVPELPFVEVQPLPVVGRSQTKTNSVAVDIDEIDKMLGIPKLPVEPGFKNRAPLQLDERAKDLVQDALKNPICITTEDLLNVSEPIRQELKKLLVKKRLAKKSVTMAAEVDAEDETSEAIALIGPICINTEDLLNVSEPTRQELKRLLVKKRLEKKSVSLAAEVDSEEETSEAVETISAERLPGATYEILAEDTNGMAKGSVVVSDPVMQYLNALAPGEKPKSVVVAAESHALRTVYPLINGSGSVESLLDPGSQIVSMSKEVATALQIPWDPDITVHMESANKSLEKTLGLAKNVPFVFGPITVYLQVHVIGRAAYKVLLGRPFDTITESEVKNSRDGSQSLTLTDLNTGERCVMHTHARGRQPTVLQKPVRQDFQRNSMN